MEPYIRMNTEFRNGAKSDFETNFYKLMNNSAFSKMIENLHNRVNVMIIGSWETDKIQKLVASPSYGRHEVFRNYLASIHMYKTSQGVPGVVPTTMHVPSLQAKAKLPKLILPRFRGDVT